MDNLNFSKIAETYEKNSLVQKSAAEKLIDLLSIKSDDSVLDIGCGTGNLTRKIRAITEGRVVGIDYAEGMINRAKEENQDLDILFEVSDVEALEYVNTFDIVFCNSVFQWFKNPEKSLNKLYNALNSGGKIGIQAPATCMYCPNFIAAIEAAKTNIRTENYFNNFNNPWFFLETAEQYTDLFSKLGFQVLFSEIERVTSNYTVQEVYNIFLSGAAAGYLNQAFYSTPIASEYIDNLQKIVFDEIRTQADKNGYVPLTFNRIFLIAQKS